MLTQAGHLTFRAVKFAQLQYTSYCTVVLYIKDHVVLGFLAQKYHHNISLKFPHNSLAVIVRHSQAQKYF